jgi:hypothetical protein
MVNDGEVAEAPAEPVTLIVKVEVPCASGVPVIVTEFPVLAPSVNPPGSAPEATDQVNGPEPPLAFTGAL